MAVSSRASAVQFKHQSFASSCCRRDPDGLLTSVPGKPLHLSCNGSLPKNRRRGPSEVHRQRIFFGEPLAEKRTRRGGRGGTSLQNGPPANAWHRSLPKNAMGPSEAFRRRGQSDVRTFAASEAAPIEEAQLDEVRKCQIDVFVANWL